MSRPTARSGGGPGDGEGFLGRWSERKLRARTLPDEADAPDAGDLARDASVPAAVPADPDAPPKTEAEILAELGLPDPDTLAKGDDFAGFMKAAVPAALRNRALRRLWLTDPVLANVDGLNDYDGDFTDAATGVKGVLKTAYKVGRGYLRDEPEPASEAEAGAEAAGARTEGSPGDAASPPEGGDAARSAVPPDADAPADAPAAEPPLPAVADDAVASAAPGPATEAGRASAPDPERPEAEPPPARRMRFSFDG